jgi:hypothetical protein
MNEVVPGADASLSQHDPADAEIVEDGPRRYELDPEPGEESEAESPPAQEADLEAKTPDDADSEEQDPAEDSDDLSKASDAFQKRIDKLTARWRDAERRVEELEAETDRAMDPQKGAPEDDILAGPRKTLADFDYDDRAYADYVEERAEAIAGRTAQDAYRQTQAQQHEAQLNREHATHVKEFSSKQKDYHDVVMDPNLPITKEVYEEARSSDYGPHMLYYLGKNPDIAASLARCPPREVIRRMARIEAVIEDSLGKAKPKAVSSAPEPAKPLKAKNPGNRRVAASEADSDKLSHKEWLRRREAEVSKNRR